MEIQVTNISHKMSILITCLESEFGTFSDFGGYNSKFKSEGKPKDRDYLENELRK